MSELRRSASAPELKSESSSTTGQGEVDWLRQTTKGKQPEKQPVEHRDNFASSSTTGQREVDWLRQTTKGKQSEKKPVEHGDNVASSSTTGQRRNFDLLEALDKDEKKRWGDQDTMSRESDSRIEIEMRSMARLSPDRDRRNVRHYTERRPRDLEEGLGPHEGNEGHHTDTDRSRSVSSERRALTDSELRRELRNIQDGMRNIMQRLDNRRDNTGRRTWGEWYNTSWNTHISTFGGIGVGFSVASTVYMLRPDLLTKALNALGH